MDKTRSVEASGRSARQPYALCAPRGCSTTVRSVHARNGPGIPHRHVHDEQAFSILAKFLNFPPSACTGPHVGMDLRKKRSAPCATCAAPVGRRRRDAWPCPSGPRTHRRPSRRISAPCATASRRPQPPLQKSPRSRKPRRSASLRGRRGVRHRPGKGQPFRDLCGVPHRGGSDPIRAQDCPGPLTAPALPPCARPRSSPSCIPDVPGFGSDRPSQARCRQHGGQAAAMAGTGVRQVNENASWSLPDTCE
jgi:hypothetical protein